MATITAPAIGMVAIAVDPATTTISAKIANARIASSKAKATSAQNRSKASVGLKNGRATRTAMMTTTTLDVIGMVATAADLRTIMIIAMRANVWTVHIK